MSEKRAVIAGAGCAGLAAGIALLKRGWKVTLLEKLDRVGGLAGGVEINGNTYEYGPHIFHTTDPEILGDVKEIAGHVLQPYVRTIKIKFLGRYFDFPLSIPDILMKLPITTVVHAGVSLVYHLVKGWFEGERALVNSEKVLQRYYGDVLYRIFFRDYIYQVWGIYPKDMAPSFAKQRIPRLNFLDFLEKISKLVFGNRREKVKTQDYVEKVEGEFFSTKKGYSLICEAFAERFVKMGGELKLSTGVDRFDMDGGRCVSVTTEGGATYPCEQAVSTLPINVLPKMMNAPAPLQEAAGALEFRGIVFVGLLVNHRNVLPASFMYFRDKSFNRVTDLSQFDVEIEPSHASIIIAEITCQPGDPAWVNEKETIQYVTDELCKEGLLKESDVMEGHVFRTAHGYPIYKAGYEENLNAVNEGLRAYGNIHSIGRQGRFAYVNTHIAMKMGYDLAREIEGGE